MDVIRLFFEHVTKDGFRLRAAFVGQRLNAFGNFDPKTVGFYCPLEGVNGFSAIGHGSENIR